jgi:hypothetical protein
MGLDRILRHQAVVPAAIVVETIAQLQTDFPISLIVMGDQTSASEWKERLAQLTSRTYAVTIAGTTDSVRIPPAPLDKAGWFYVSQ